MIKMKTFDNGVRLIVNRLPFKKICTFAIAANVGSCCELDSEEGLSHFLEHMCFKGTKTRTANELKDYALELGAGWNAITSAGFTAYHLEFVKEKINECVDLQCDMFFNSTFPKDEFEKERNVILEEIKMYDDDPDIVLEEATIKSAFKGTTFSHPIAGSPEQIANYKVEDIVNYRNKHYTKEGIVVYFSGNITLEEAEKIYIERVKKFFDAKAGVPSKNVAKNCKLRFKKELVLVDKEITQVRANVVYNFENDFSKKIPAFNIAKSILNNKLFKAIREKLGLVYNIYLDKTSRYKGGFVEITIGLTENNLKLALTEINALLKTLVEKGITKKEFNDAKFMQLCTLSKYEDQNAPSMYYTLLNFFKVNKFRTFKAEEKKLNAVTLDEVNNLIKQIFSADAKLVVVGAKNADKSLLDIVNAR